MDVNTQALVGSETSDAIVELAGVTRAFNETVAVRDLYLTLRRGEFFSLLGPSGCGKTTTLRMIAGFERPDAGEVRIGGHNMIDVPPERRPVNTVFQSYALFEHLNVFENVAFGLREQRRPRREIEQRVGAALELVQMSGLERRRTRQLSGGQQQRVALARSIVMRPMVLLLDEPLGALDFKLRKAMQVELKRLQRQLGITFLYVTHDQEEALLMSDRLAVMRQGRLEQLGTPEDIYNRPTSRYVADFVGEANILEGKIAAVEGDCATLEIAGVGPVFGLANSPLMLGETAFLVIRPERIDVAPAEKDALPRERSALSGTIVEVLFSGMAEKYLVQLSSGARLTATHTTRRALGQIRAGNPVELSWATADACVISQAAEAAVSRSGVPSNGA